MIKVRQVNLTGFFVSVLSLAMTLAVLLKKFYFSGVNYDAPIITNLMWHNAGLNIFYNLWQGNGSFYQSHSSLIFIIISKLSYVLPLNMVEYTCFVFALSTSLLGYVVTQILYRFKENLKIDGLSFFSLTTLLSLGFVFNVYNVDSIYLVHFEIFYISFLVSFLYYFFTYKYYTSYFFLLLFLIVREDFGFHLFTLISIILFFDHFIIKAKHLPSRKLIIICLVSLVASIMLCYMKKFFPGDDAFSRVYFNTKWPAILETFDSNHLAKNLILFGKKNIFTIVSFALSIIFAIRYRAYFILISLISILPWLFLHLLSQNDHTVIMGDYYKFPFAIILIWPALACLIFRNVIADSLRIKIYFLQIIIILFSLIHTISFYTKSIPLVSISNIVNSNLFAEEVRKFADNGNLKNMRVTLDILTLDTRLYKKDNVVLVDGVVAENNFDKDKIVFYNTNDSFIYEPITKHGYKNALKIKNTPIRVQTNSDQLAKYFSNLEVNNSFWIDALSLPKNYRYINSNETLKIEPFKVNLVVKKPVYLYHKKYCVDISQQKPIENLFSVYRMSNNNEVFKHLIQDEYNHLCFNIAKDDSYYFVLNPVKKQSIITAFSITNFTRWKMVD